MSFAMMSLLKFAGGKSWVTDQFAHLLPAPADVSTYHEPFVGCGAVGKLYLGETRCFLNDKNDRLMAMYEGVREDPGGVFSLLTIYAQESDPKFYYDVRQKFNERPRTDASATQAARFIYLNRAGDNGLIRENKAGGFNSPYGKYHSPGDCRGTHPTKAAAALCAKKRLAGEPLLEKHNAIAVPDLATFTAWSEKLSTATLHAGDFEPEIRGYVGQGSFVFLDPPYVPVSTTTNFTGYSAGGFGPEDQDRLLRMLDVIDGRGARFLLTNAVEAMGLYAPRWNVREVAVGRAINSNKDKRGKVGEILVANYALHEDGALPVRSANEYLATSAPV